MFNIKHFNFKMQNCNLIKFFKTTAVSNVKISILYSTVFFCNAQLQFKFYICEKTKFLTLTDKINFDESTQK